MGMYVSATHLHVHPFPFLHLLYGRPLFCCGFLFPAISRELFPLYMTGQGFFLLMSPMILVLGTNANTTLIPLSTCLR